ncbi:MAG: hypothetical protein Q8O13_04965 [Candidatus Omnitrophota bacterium]|nr:hypothetical protein [Candidatus Omnitrophota bacterium]
MVDLTFFEAIIQLMRALMAFALMGSLFIFLAPNTYAKVNQVLMKEYGIKKRFVPWLETEKKSIDVWVLKKRGMFGVLFVAISFVLIWAIR